ncbi:hypothetical protein EDWATA_01739 [Edwardsiella tarda ATCC 23685]|uniref:Uncharacterized protein n=1 Tax=Edwardsiella tarda ATCC 23685 TaxID=500638 RepID=D4F4R6_EDWTA|nr:hypothetical protein EDWATA_01739 [Edwardsiella tarda ATCC 23685]
MSLDLCCACRNIKKNSIQCRFNGELKASGNRRMHSGKENYG